MNSDLRKMLFEIQLQKEPASEIHYMDRDQVGLRVPADFDDELPVNLNKSDWDVSSDSLSRVYQIENRDHFAYFVGNILDHAKELHHDPSMIISYPKISIKLKPHDLEEVTEIDLEFAKFIDEIYEDITFLQENF